MRRVSASLLLTSLLVAAAPAFAQIQSRPTDAPIVTADNESWYVNREPMQFAGDLYYPAGAAVFFNGNTMVRSGHYNGVPLYTDTTIEPYSIVYVPIQRGLMQPYERPRQGAAPWPDLEKCLVGRRRHRTQELLDPGGLEEVLSETLPRKWHRSF